MQLIYQSHQKLAYKLTRMRTGGGGGMHGVMTHNAMIPDGACMGLLLVAIVSTGLVRSYRKHKIA